MITPFVTTNPDWWKYCPGLKVIAGPEFFAVVARQPETREQLFAFVKGGTD